MFTKTKTSLSAAIILGALGTVALASDHEDQHWDSYKEMVRLEQIQHASPTTGTFAANAYGFVRSAHKPGSLRLKAKADY
jgi:hypothetical protein